MRSKEEVMQILRDAGCARKLAEEIGGLLAEGRDKEAFEILSRHRKSLLDSVHKYNKNIDCLDYLVYTIEKDGKNEKNE